MEGERETLTNVAANFTKVVHLVSQVGTDDNTANNHQRQVHPGMWDGVHT